MKMALKYMLFCLLISTIGMTDAAQSVSHSLCKTVRAIMPRRIEEKIMLAVLFGWGTYKIWSWWTAPRLQRSMLPNDMRQDVEKMYEQEDNQPSAVIESDPNGPFSQRLTRPGTSFVDERVYNSQPYQGRTAPEDPGLEQERKKEAAHLLVAIERLNRKSN